VCFYSLILYFLIIYFIFNKYKIGNQIISSTKDSDGFYTITFRKVDINNIPSGDVITKTKMHKYTVKNYIMKAPKINQPNSAGVSDKFIEDFFAALIKNFILNGSIFSMKAGDEVYFNVNDFTSQNSQYNIEMIKRYIYALENNYSDAGINSDYFRTFAIPSNYTLPIEPNPDKPDTNSKNIDELLQKQVGELTTLIIGFLIFIIIIFIFLKLI
jgi:hypothetical protein